MKAWVRQIFAVISIIAGFIVFMFSYPQLYDAFGKFPTLSLWFVFMFVCEIVWQHISGTQNQDK